MDHSQQEFTFINVTGGKRQNTRTVKRHVSNQTNRRKRQEAVLSYQQSLLQSTDQSNTNDAISLSLRPGPKKSREAPAASSNSITSSEEFCSSEREEEYHEFEPQRHVKRGQPLKEVDFWPAFQAWAQKHLKPARSSPPKEPISLKRARKTDEEWRITVTSSQSNTWAVIANTEITIRIPHIDPPTEQYRSESILTVCSEYIRSSYASSWKSQWQDESWFRGDMIPLGIWRECFPLSVEFIRAGKLQEAFFVLNAAFNTTSAFLKENSPGLLIACLGAMMWTCQISDKKLSALIRIHITQLSIAHLGPKHPISQILREQIYAAENTQGRTDLLGVFTIDTFSDIFGPEHHIPLSMRFGYVRRQMSSGDYDGALASIGKLEEVWNPKSMPASQLPRFVAFEKAKVIQAQQRANRSNSSLDLDASVDLGKIAENSIQIPSFVPGQGPTLLETDRKVLKSLGKHLLLGSHYALALHVFSHLSSVFESPNKNDRFTTMNQVPETLPITVARILVRHLEGDEAGSPQTEMHAYL